MNLAPSLQLHAYSAKLPDGMAGIFKTIRVMRALLNQSKIDPVIRQAAVSCVFLTPEKSALSEVSALFYFVRDHIRYLHDINGVETIATPDKTLQSKIGDCDDQSLLLGALFESIGYVTRFIVAGYHVPGMVEHVYIQVCADGEWIDCDPTEREPLGYAPPDPVTIYVENI